MKQKPRYKFSELDAIMRGETLKFFRRFLRENSVKEYQEIFARVGAEKAEEMFIEMLDSGFLQLQFKDYTIRANGVCDYKGVRLLCYSKKTDDYNVMAEL